MILSRDPCFPNHDVAPPRLKLYGRNSNCSKFSALTHSGNFFRHWCGAGVRGQREEEVFYHAQSHLRAYATEMVTLSEVPARFPDLVRPNDITAGLSGEVIKMWWLHKPSISPVRSKP